MLRCCVGRKAGTSSMKIIRHNVCGATLAGCLLFLVLFMAPAAKALNIEIDYSYDTNGLFTDMVTGEPLADRRALMDEAVSYYSGFVDPLDAIMPLGTDSWSVSIPHPSNYFVQNVLLTDMTLAADTVRIFVGGSPLGAGGVLGIAHGGTNLQASDSAYLDAILSRGQANAYGLGATDYSPWGGSIWFNMSNDWYFGQDTSRLVPGHPDFLTTAIHEIGHILGFGVAGSWHNQIDNNGFFTGAASVLEYGSLVPLDPNDSHWAEGTTSDVNGMLQETLMDPSTPTGTRQLLTSLDYAGFEDIGWEVAAVPVPAAIWLFMSGLVGLAAFARRS